MPFLGGAHVDMRRDWLWTGSGSSGRPRRPRDIVVACLRLAVGGHVETLKRSFSTMSAGVVEGRDPSVVGNESTGVTFSVGAAARQPASSSLVLVPTSFVLAPCWSSA